MTDGKDRQEIMTVTKTDIKQTRAAKIQKIMRILVIKWGNSVKIAAANCSYTSCLKYMLNYA